MAKRHLDKVPIETNPSSNAGDRVPGCPTGVDMDAKRSSDVNVTVRPRTSNRARNSGIRQRRDWLFNAKNWLELITCGTV